MDPVTSTPQVTSGAVRAGDTKQRRKIVDWISEPRTVELTPFQQFTVDVDWKKSPLGPMSGWPKQLRSMVLLCFADPKPVSVLFVSWLSRIFLVVDSFEMDNLMTDQVERPLSCGEIIMQSSTMNHTLSLLDVNILHC